MCASVQNAMNTKDFAFLPCHLCLIKQTLVFKSSTVRKLDLLASLNKFVRWFGCHQLLYHE